MPGIIVKWKDLLVNGLKLAVKLIAVILKFMLWLIIKLKNLLVKGLELAVMLVTGILVVDVVWGVFTRYVLGHQSQWTEELARLLLIWVALLGASIAFIRKSHLGVDYFVGKLNEKWQTIGQILVYLLVAIFAGIVLVYGGCSLVSSALKNSQPTPALNLEMGYVYLAVPISGIFIIIFSIETIIEMISSLLGKDITSSNG
jgi:TRAP-type C4-dicarboxylate transport system permease small subunit